MADAKPVEDEPQNIDVRKSELIEFEEFFSLVLSNGIKLTNDREHNVFTSWKVGGQDFYAYGRSVEV